MPAVAIANPQVARFLSAETRLISFNLCSTRRLAPSVAQQVPRKLVVPSL
jgi:hypothetical protein